MQGLRTFAISLLLAIAPAATTYFASVDWTALFAGLVGQQYAVPLAMVVSAVVMAAMRSITTTPPGRKPQGGAS